MVDHEQNGYLAQPFDVQDLGRGMAWVLDHPDHGRLAASARQKVVGQYELGHIARRHRALYEDVLRQHAER